MPPAMIDNLTLIHQPSSGQYTVIGLLKNNSPLSVVDVSVRVSLRNNAGEVVAEQLIPLLMRHVSPGEDAPFQAAFPDSEQVNTAEAHIMVLPRGAFERAPLTISILGPPSKNGGQYTVLGRLSNPGITPAKIHQLVLMATDLSGAPQELIVLNDRLSIILPEETIPFLATFEQSPNLSHLSSYIDATITSKPSPVPLIMVQPPRVTFDSQGNILVIGAIKNQASLPYWLSGLILLKHGDEILSLATLRPPSPLGPGETRSFGIIEFPGWIARLATMGRNREDLTAEFLIDPLTSMLSNMQTRQLDLEVTGLENTGSTFIIRGSIYNPTLFTITQPAVHAEFRSVDAITQSANWLILQDRLDSHQSASFLLPLRLPGEIDLSMMEMDIRAMGLIDAADFPAGLEP